ncbi:MAG: VCBS repeat-containing protein, partial [Acidiferrobacterales bacterium]|nr:VCBS repeat-containing protein [Acidiferrobacterales bacterium]
MLGLLTPQPIYAQLDWSEAQFIPRNTAEVGVGDFDKDGNVDIAVAGSDQRWYAGPDFTTWHKIGESDGGPYAAQVADINADGWLDFITSDGARTANDIPGHLYVYLNPGENGNVTDEWNRITVYTGNVRHQNDLRIADMDNDGRLDIIERTWSSERVVVAMQNANINNWTVRAFDTGESGTPEGISAGDIDGDSEMEIVLSGVYWDNPGGWRSGDPIEHTIDTNFVGATYGKVKSAVGDINNDGLNDIYMGSAEGSDRYLAWYENTGNTTPTGGVELVKHIIKDNFGKCHMVQLVDIDQDGDLDLATGRSFGQNGLLIFYNNNNGESWTEQDYDATGTIYTGVVADLDKDGDFDVVGPSRFYGGNVRYYINESNVIPANPLQVEPTSLSFSASGGSESISITTEVGWTASSDQTWVTISPSNGNGSSTVAISVGSFSGFGSRSALISISNGDISRTVNLIQQGVEDTAAPTTPENLIVSDIDYDSVHLSWDASSDNSGQISEYVIYVNGNEHSRTESTNTLITGLLPLTNYSLTVTALDQENNQSTASIPSVIQTLSRPPSPPPVFYWKLNENRGTTATDSGGSTPGTLSTPDGPEWVAGKFGNGLLFGGDSARVELGNMDAPSSAFTISAWIRPTDINNHPEGRIISKATGSNESQHYWMLSTIQSGNSTVPRVRLKTGGTTTTLIGTQTSPVTNNNWFHIVATYGDGELTLYNNGTDVGSATKTGSVDQANSVPVTMGNQPAGDRGFHGIIDDICIFDFALSPDQVAEFYDDGQGFSCDALPDNEPLDTSPPVIAELSGVNSPTFDTTPRYIFSSSEAGTASFGGGCDNTPDTAVTAGA